jgi:apolipoprotein N-acyltransferase
VIPFRPFQSLFSDDRLVSRQYIGLFSLSALLCLAVIALLPYSLEPLKMTLWLRVPLTLLGISAPVGFFFIWLGMWFYWVRFDSSRNPAKVLWFIVLLVGFCFGAALYFAFVYLPQVTRRNAGRS